MGAERPAFLAAAALDAIEELGQRRGGQQVNTGRIERVLNASVTRTSAPVRVTPTSTRTPSKSYKYSKQS